MPSTSVKIREDPWLLLAEAVVPTACLSTGP
jgi:hypothetical protein